MIPQGTPAPERIDRLELTPSPFLDGPAEYLVKTIASEIAKTAEWRYVFGENIDGYRRMDYPMRGLPALRVYNNGYSKDQESWFETGEVNLDVILPANLRRNELQQVQDRISAALIQQFRRTEFFEAVAFGVPGLNELGKVMSIDKSMGFEWGEELLPLTQLTANFRLDLRQWDNYLEQQCRTKEDPFNVTLGSLRMLGLQIQGMLEANANLAPESTSITLSQDQIPTGGQ